MELRGNWRIPTDILAGAGRIAELPERVTALGLKRALVVTDPGVATLPFFAAILASPTSQVKGTKDTAFSLLQAVVEYADHDRTTRTSEGGDAEESRLVSATWGSGAGWRRSWETTGTRSS